MGRLSFMIKWFRLHKRLKLLITFWVFFLVQQHTVWGSDVDKSALLEFKGSISDPYGVLSSWNSNGGDHCRWLGVSCDSGSRVVALNISGGGNSLSCARISQFQLYGFGIRRPCLGSNSKGEISGKLSSSIAKLTELKILSLPFNELSGEIPAEIWGMEKLEVLDLEGNLISGSLPVQFKGLKNLKVLNLGFNQIFGEIPSSFSSFLGLQLMNLAGNRVNGSMPKFIGGFKDLRGLYLSFNQLGGSIPSEIGGDCGKLEHLELAGNILVEGIPRSLGKCRGLKTLLLYSNMLEEVIPSELGQLSQLEVLDVSRNNLGGSIPPNLGNCSRLSVLVLSNLWDPLPNVSSSRQSLSFTADEYNFYEGTIPEEITALPSLRMVWAPRATLEGQLPGSWGSCKNLEMLNLAQNYYSGKISEGFGNCTNLHFLNLSSNKLSGEIFEEINVPCMTLFDVSGNYLSGSIPKFKNETCAGIQSSPPLRPYDSTSAYISYFTYRTKMETSLPLFDDGDSFTVFHNFGSNNLTGVIQSMTIASERLGKQTVYAFFAGGNRLSGPFPGSLFEKCDQVRGMIVNVSNNDLSGEFPSNSSSICKSLMLLAVSRNQIGGILPNSIGNLASLLSLDLSWNPLGGQIPGSLGQIKNLERLSLAGNNLTGPIPESFGQLFSLKVLDLSSNSLSGEIPKDIAFLRNLTVLLLNNNNLSGQIPQELANMTSLSSFNVSFNNLSGPLPLNDMLAKCNSVLGNPSLQHCRLSSSSPSDQPGRTGDSTRDPSPPSRMTTQRNKSSGFNSIEIASIASAAAIVSVLIALILLFCYTRKRKPRSRVSGTTRKEVIVFTDIGVPLTFENVVRATGSFNASNCIGNGGFGATYKAEIAPGVLVAIKRLALGRFQGVQQFDAEIKTLGRLHHPNLVTLIGYHASETEMFLIYNYLPGGNLERFIQERSTRAVDWRVLHKIALDIARALAYLHDTCVPRVLHRDVKPSNILLDEDYNAYLSDFGLARLLGTSETHATTGVAGTFGYVAPEYAMTCRVSDKADVYSYGVVLLELLSDKKALDPSFSNYGNGFNIVTWACMLLRQGRANEFFTSGLWDGGPHDDLVEVLHLAVVCTVDTLSNRPTMKQVVRRLKQLQPPSC